jgi:hypothetical protein
MALASAKKTKSIIRSHAAAPVNARELIRHFMARHPAAGPTAIEAGLMAEGIKVTWGLINDVKHRLGKEPGKKRKKRNAVQQVAARVTPSSPVSIEQLIEVKRFVNALGGADQVRRALDMLEQLQ